MNGGGPRYHWLASAPPKPSNLASAFLAVPLQFNLELREFPLALGKFDGNEVLESNDTSERFVELSGPQIRKLRRQSGDQFLLLLPVAK